jgi:hypothetical protein
MTDNEDTTADVADVEREHANMYTTVCDDCRPAIYLAITVIRSLDSLQVVKKITGTSLCGSAGLLPR